eukprot:228678-Hanusia_phi.AAC.2
MVAPDPFKLAAFHSSLESPADVCCHMQGERVRHRASSNLYPGSDQLGMRSEERVRLSIA